MRKCAGCLAALTADNTYKGIFKWCRDCWKAKVRARRRINPATREYDRQRAKTAKRKEHMAKVSKKWRADNKEAYRAHTLVNNAVRDGRLTREPCLFCESEENLHAHHRDYSKPLDVVWVCAKCHHRLHALERAA